MKILGKIHPYRFSARSSAKDAKPIAAQGIHGIPRITLESYAKRRTQKGDEHIKDARPLITSVLNLKKAIETEPILKMGFEGGLETIPQGGILHGKTPDQVYHMLSAICVTAPKFENVDLVGIPIFSLFVDFLATRLGQAFFSNPLTNYHLKRIFKDYQIMLESKVSLKYMTEAPDGWFSREAQEKINYSEYQIDKSKPHWGFRNWNQWFTRHIKPETRPLDENAKAIVHSSDSYPLVYPPGSKGRNPATNVKGDSHFWLKDSLYSLHDMFDSKKMGIEDLVNEHFVGGTVYQAFLDPFCYHRWHSPVSGTILYSYLIEGSFYLDNPGLPLDGKDNYVNSHPMLSVISTRQVFIIQLDDGSGRLVAIIEIGMGEVSGCQPTVVQSQLIKKGEELGYFAFGGSSYAMVFDKGLELEFNKEAFIVDTKAKPGKVQARKQKVNSLLCSFR